jgi:hypothetical protein
MMIMIMMLMLMELFWEVGEVKLDPLALKFGSSFLQGRRFLGEGREERGLPRRKGCWLALCYTRLHRDPDEKRRRDIFDSLYTFHHIH